MWNAFFHHQQRSERPSATGFTETVQIVPHTMHLYISVHKRLRNLILGVISELPYIPSVFVFAYLGQQLVCDREKNETCLMSSSWKKRTEFAFPFEMK